MKKLTCAVVLAAATGLSVLSPSVASAAPTSDPTTVPLLRSFKTCNFIQQDNVAARGYGRATAHVSTSGADVTADVDIATAPPNVRYDVRIIQTPRPSIGCGPGAPGVITGSLQTDPGGAGRTTLTGPIAPNATGAWIIMALPAPYSQTPAEFYTSEFIAKI